MDIVLWMEIWEFSVINSTFYQFQLTGWLQFLEKNVTWSQLPGVHRNSFWEAAFEDCSEMTGAQAFSLWIGLNVGEYVMAVLIMPACFQAQFQVQAYSFPSPKWLRTKILDGLPACL